MASRIADAEDVDVEVGMVVIGVAICSWIVRVTNVQVLDLPGECFVALFLLAPSL